MSESLRILMVSDVSPSVVLGGAERFVWEEARHLAERGHRVRVVSRTPAEAAPGDIQTIAGVSIHHFGAARRTDHAFVRTSILGAQRAVAAALAREPADVLHLHQPLSGFGVLVSAAGRRLPSLYTFHSPAPLEYRSRLGMTGFHRGGVRGHLGSVLLRAVEGACVRRATRVHVLSEFSARLLVSLYGVSHDRIVRIAGGVDTSRFRPARDRRATKAALGVDPRRTLLFTVRNLEARMGLDDLVRRPTGRRTKSSGRSDGCSVSTW